MHELSIAQSILDTVGREMQKFPDAKPECVGLRIGELAGINPDALEFCFGALVTGTPWSDLRLNITYLSGDELDFEYLEVDEHEPSTAAV